MRAVISILLLSLLFAPAISQANALQDAARKGDIAAVEAALKAGADVNARDGSNPPLYYAVKKGHLEVAKLLIAHGADVNATTTYKGPILLAAAEIDRSDLIALLLTSGADPDAAFEEQAALHIAAKRGCFACVKVLVEAGANVNSVIVGDYARSPIHLATLYEHSDVVDYLMAHGVVLPKPEPISDLLKTADPDKGGLYFGKNCAYCHDLNTEVSHKRGPNLWNVVGRDKASFPGQLYSKALRSWEGNWTYDDLNYWIYGFAVGRPGVMMEIPGVTDNRERANLIAYLRLGSDTPMPLP